nr:DNA-directed DNA polymerase [Tanacetum cinerariifolium]
MEITCSIELYKHMRSWFVQEIAEEEDLLKFLYDRSDDLRRKNDRRRVLIREMEALGERGVAVDSLESLKQTHARETAKLAALTGVIAESLAGIREKKRHITSTMRYPNVPNTSIKLMLFSFSVEGATRIWLEKELPRSILTWEDLVSRFINQFFPPLKTTNLHNKITNFRQRFDESFCEAWDHFKDLLRACPHHGFTKLHQLDTFYNAINPTDQDSLNAAAGGNFLDKMPRDCLRIIESKSKVCNSRNKPIVSRVSTNTSSTNITQFPEVVALTDAVKDLLRQNKTLTLASVKAVEDSYVTCGGPHPYYNCTATDGNAFKDNIQEYVLAAAVNYNQGNTRFHPHVTTNYRANQISPPGFPPVQNNQNRYNQNQNQSYNQNRGNNYQALIQQPQVEPLNEFSKYKKMNTASSSGSGSLPSNTIANPKGDLKAITTRSGVFMMDLQFHLRWWNENQRRQRTSIHFDLPFADALLYMPKFAATFKSLLNNKETLFELANTSLNENCLAVLLKKLPEKLRDPSKKKISLPKLTPTRMTLELADRSSRRLVGVAEDVFVKVETFHFLADFVVVDFDVDPRVPLILERPFLRTTHALIDVHSEELTLRINDEAITLPLDKLREIEACLASKSFPLEIDDTGFDPEGDIRLLEKLLNDDPSSSPLPPKKLNVEEIKTVKSSIDEPPELELKDLPSHCSPLKVLKSHKRAIAWKIFDIKGIDPQFCTHKILMENDFKPAVQHQRRVNLKIHEVIKKEVIKLLDAGLIYPISDSPWVSPVHCVPKKGGMTVVTNEDNELIPTSLVTGWRVCIEYRKLNDATRKDHFSLPFMDQMLKRLARNEFYCFLDGFSGYFHIPIDPQDQENTTFTCPYGTFAYRRMPFGLCNAPGTFQMSMMAIFHDMIEEMMKFFIDDFSIFGDSLSSCLSHLEKMLKRCEDTNLVLNWEKCHFMVKESIVLGHKISKSRIEVDKAKVDVIAKLSHPTTVKGIRSFLGHVGFYRRFIQDFLKIARPMTHLLEKETPFIFSKECVESFETLKKKLTKALILVAPIRTCPLRLCVMLVILR